MSFNDNDFKGFRSQLLKVFCHQVAEIKKTPDLISLVRSEADYINYCRKITNSDGRSRRMFASFCEANGFNTHEIQIRVCLVATVLGVYKQADYYGILGVAPNADGATIKQAYRKKAKVLHPDKCDGAQGRSDEFIELHAAYSHLRDPKMRELYDAIPEVKGPWGTDSHTASPSRRRTAVGRVVGWVCVVVGSMVVFTYAFDVYQNKSIDLRSQEHTEAQVNLDLPENMNYNDPVVADSGNSRLSTKSGLSVKRIKVTEPKPLKVTNDTLSVTSEKVLKLNSDDGETVDSAISTTDAKPQEAQTGDTVVKIETPVYIVQKERVLSFLNRYTKTYEERDLKKFRAFFTNDAMEQGQPFESLVPKYQRTFKNIKSMEYKIEVASLSMKREGYKILVDGDFTAKFQLANNRKGSSYGSIRMELLDEPEGLLVTRLDYKIGD